MVFAAPYEVHCSLATHLTKGICTPWASMDRVVFADDATWPCDSPEAVQGVLEGLEAADESGLCSDALKTVVVGSRCSGWSVHALSGTFTLHGSHRGAPDKVTTSVSKGVTLSPTFTTLPTSSSSWPRCASVPQSSERQKYQHGTQ